MATKKRHIPTPKETVEHLAKGDALVIPAVESEDLYWIDAKRFGNLAELQSLVGGYIEIKQLAVTKTGLDTSLVFNEDGKRKKLPRNVVAFKLWDIELVGTVIVGQSELL